MNERKGFLLFLIAILGAVAFLMIKPFLGYFFGAVIIAFVLHPVQKKLSPILGTRPSAFLLVILSVVAFILPILGAGIAVIDDARDLTGDINTTSLINATALEEDIKRMTGRDVDIEQNINNAIDRFTDVSFGSFSQLISLVADLAVGI
ncbi:MAG: AI-2E family transporter, partial [Candidatus Aenigmatarchaeota archaeon]